MASVLLEWFTITEIGDTASASAPTVAPIRPHCFTTVAYTNTTARTPATTCGTSNDIWWNPNTFTTSACTCNDTGGLSTVMNPTLSSEPYQKACQLSAMLRTAAE